MEPGRFGDPIKMPYPESRATLDGLNKSRASITIAIWET